LLKPFGSPRKSPLLGRTKTDWVCLDCELMPWSAKAQALLKDQYAAVGAAASAALDEVVGVLEQANGNAADVSTLLVGIAIVARWPTVRSRIQQYCWPVDDVGDLKLAHFISWRQKGRYMWTNLTMHMETFVASARRATLEHGYDDLLPPLLIELWTSPTPPAGGWNSVWRTHRSRW